MRAIKIIVAALLLLAAFVGIFYKSLFVMGITDNPMPLLDRLPWWVQLILFICTMAYLGYSLDRKVDKAQSED